MANENEFAWAGPLPVDGRYAGFIRISVEEDGVVFAVRAVGSVADAVSYKIPQNVATVLLANVSVRLREGAF